jgi:hypothetical protein
MKYTDGTINKEKEKENADPEEPHGRLGDSGIELGILRRSKQNYGPFGCSSDFGVTQSFGAL